MGSPRCIPHLTVSTRVRAIVESIVGGPCDQQYTTKANIHVLVPPRQRLEVRERLIRDGLTILTCSRAGHLWVAGPQACACPPSVTTL